MTQSESALHHLKNLILETSLEERYHLQPELNAAIMEMERRGQDVPIRFRELNEDLLADAIEAQFDNMPV